MNSGCMFKIAPNYANVSLPNSAMGPQKSPWRSAVAHSVKHTRCDINVHVAF